MRAAGAGAVLLGASGCGHVVPSPRGSGTNVVLVIVDSLRKDHVGAYGNDWIQTPSLDALARESLRFTRAYPDTMPTIPTRRAIHTGMRTFPVNAPDWGWRPIPAGQATLAEILKDKGYAIFLVTDTCHQWKHSMNFGRGFDVYRKVRGQVSDPYKDPSVISIEEVRQRYMGGRNAQKARQYLANVQGRKSEEDWFAPKVFTSEMEALEEARRREPFFLVADCFDPHEPWDPPERYVDLYDPDGYEGKEPLADRYGTDDYVTDRQLLRMRALYAAEVTMADRWLGNFLQKAHDLGVMENTLLVVISDHGHALGEHGYLGKPPRALWPELTDIALFVRHPEEKRSGEESDYYASTHDVAPTVLGFLGIEPPRPMDGQDLTVLLEEGEPEPRDHFTLVYGTVVCCRDEQYVLVCRYNRTSARLYDIRTDPLQTRNLIEDDPETAEKMFEEYALKDAGGSLPPD
ncbi:MAG: sulfatase [Actinomycetota bacterium]|nr:sulfatase [Actinomycetota bacterium]